MSKTKKSQSARTKTVSSTQTRNQSSAFATASTLSRKYFSTANQFRQKIWQQIQNHRLAVFGLLLIAFVAVLLATRFTQKAQTPAAEITQPTLKVNVMRFGDSDLHEEAVGMVKNLTTVTLVAQTTGPVARISVSEGQAVSRGTTLVQQESAYAAGNAQAVQLQVADQNLKLAQKTLDSTVKQVSLNRELADKSLDNTEELRKITEESISDTKTIIDVTEDVVEYLEEQLEAERAGANDPAIVTGLQQQLLPYYSSLSQTRSSLRSIEYQIKTDSPQYRSAEIQKDLAYESTELQLETARIQKELAALNVRAARIAFAATRVQAPIAGQVEKIYVQPGEFVTAGTPVAVITGQPKLVLEINVAGKVALQVNPTEPVIMHLGDQTVSLPISHVSAAPVSGQLYQVLADVPAQFAQQIVENQAVSVTLPLYETSIVAGNSFIPLDALFVTNTGRFVFVDQNGTAVRKTVETGEIVGTSIEIKTGLVPGDEIILDRRVIEGQPVESTHIENQTMTVIELG